MKIVLARSLGSIRPSFINRNGQEYSLPVRPPASRIFAYLWEADRRELDIEPLEQIAFVMKAEELVEVGSLNALFILPTSLPPTLIDSGYRLKKRILCLCGGLEEKALSGGARWVAGAGQVDPKNLLVKLSDGSLENLYYSLSKF